MTTFSYTWEGIVKVEEKYFERFWRVYKFWAPLKWFLVCRPSVCIFMFLYDCTVYVDVSVASVWTVQEFRLHRLLRRKYKRSNSKNRDPLPGPETQNTSILGNDSNDFHRISVIYGDDLSYQKYRRYLQENKDTHTVGPKVKCSICANLFYRSDGLHFCSVFRK
jgi:hypothetical protein